MAEKFDVYKWKKNHSVVYAGAVESGKDKLLVSEGAMGRQQSRISREQSDAIVLKAALRKQPFFKKFIDAAEEFVTSNPVPGHPYEDDNEDIYTVEKIILGAIEDNYEGHNVYEEEKEAPVLDPNNFTPRK